MNIYEPIIHQGLHKIEPPMVCRHTWHQNIAGVREAFLTHFERHLSVTHRIHGAGIYANIKGVY